MTSKSQNESVHVNLDERSYDIIITSGGLDEFPSAYQSWVEKHPYWKTEVPKGLIVTDSNVEQHAKPFFEKLKAAGWNVELQTVPAGEATKSVEKLTEIHDQLVDMQADRRTVVIAMGGGVVGDLAGFAAASYARGLPFIQAPTTLLANVDSSVGGKVGINHPKGKNLIGDFHQPLGVFIDTELMQTLEDREFRSGLAEVVKYGVILDAEFFGELENNISAINDRDPAFLRKIIARSCQLKADVVEKDEEERIGLRAILNYGHTFAHAYENLAGYGELLHGEAVSIGMQDAAKLAFKMDRIDEDLVNRQTKLLEAIHLPTTLPENLNLAVDDLVNAMLLDKKTVGGKLRFILPTKLGHVEQVSDVDTNLVREVLS